MRCHFILLTALAVVCFFPHYSWADTVSDDEAFNERVWQLRITNHVVIGKQKSMIDFAAWCKVESQKDHANGKPCEILSREGVSAEGALMDSIPITKAIVERLKTMSDSEVNQDHIRAFEKQLEEMESMPTPLHDLAQKAYKRMGANK